MLVRINGKEYKLDLSFVRKTDKVLYSTEMCVALKKFVDDYKLNQIIDFTETIRNEEILTNSIKK